MKKILIYGVHHWFSESSKEEKRHLNEWLKRLRKFIPNTDIFIATGSYSAPALSPFPKDIPIIQNKISYTKPYSVHQNYFRNGFMTGVWHSLLNHNDWDVLFHIQPRVLLGVDMKDILEYFIKHQEFQVLAPNLCGEGGTMLEISFFGMKPLAAQVFCLGGLRNTFVDEKVFEDPWNVEQEAYSLFHKERYNPWPHVMTTRQLDRVAKDYGAGSVYSSFTMFDINEFAQLPLISTGLHATKDFIAEWKRNHKI